MQAPLIEQMKTLRLRGMANALEESLTALSQKKLAPTRWLEQLLQAEIAERQARSYQYQLRLARFPMPRDLATFDFRESAVNETQIRQLHTGEYLNSAATSCSSAARVPARRIWPPRSPARRTCRASACASTASSIWSTSSMPRSAKAKPAVWPAGSSTSTSSCSTS